MGCVRASDGQFLFFLFALNFTDNKRSSEEIFGNEANNLYVVMLSKFNY